MKGRNRRGQRKWVVALAVLGVIGLTVGWWLPPLQGTVSEYLRLEWSDKDQRASVYGVVVGVLSLLWSILLGVAQMRQASRLAASARGPLDLGQDADRRLRAHLGPTRRLPRMAEVSPRQARVHTAIPAPPQPSGSARRGWWAPWRTTQPALDPDLPLFVERDLWPEILQWTRQARRDGGFLLLVGTSSVGKTRLLFEAARRELGDFRTVIPVLGDGGLVNAWAAEGPREPLIVWLDELQRFLPGPYFTTDQATGHTPLTAAAIRHLLNCDTPVVVLGTLWPGYVHQLRATDTDPATQTTRPRYPQAVDIINLATHYLAVSSFSGIERDAAARLASQDPRLAAAVANQDYNVTETLAGAPAILRRYREALPEHQAVIHAAADARRMGIQGPLTAALLRDATRGYLTSVQTDDTWFDDALHTLTRSDRRDDAATAPLITLADPEHRTVLGYTVADYLLQHLLRRRRSTLLPDITWHALEHHTLDHDDLTRLADNAYRRMQYALATRIHRALVNADDPLVDYRLDRLLVEQGKVDEAIAALRTAADSGDTRAPLQLAELLVGQGNVDEAMAVLRTAANAGDAWAALQLAKLLVSQNKVDEAVAVLRAAASAGEAEVTDLLAELLIRQGKVDELRALADAGDTWAALRLADLLEEWGEVDEAVAVLRTSADAGKLADLLVRQGKVDEAMAVLRTAADAGNTAAHMQLALLLEKQGKADEAMTMLQAAVVAVDTSDSFAPGFEVAVLLADMLLQQGKVDELRALANAGNTWAASLLAQFWEEQGKVDEAVAVLQAAVVAGADDTGDNLAELLARQGNVGELRALADAGNITAQMQLVELLAEQGKVNDLWQEVHAGTATAAEELVRALNEHDGGAGIDVEQLRRWGLTADGGIAQPQ